MAAEKVFLSVRVFFFLRKCFFMFGIVCNRAYMIWDSMRNLSYNLGHIFYSGHDSSSLAVGLDMGREVK
jgi:hypothetical protein